MILPSLASYWNYLLITIIITSCYINSVNSMQSLQGLITHSVNSMQSLQGVKYTQCELHATITGVKLTSKLRVSLYLQNTI